MNISAKYSYINGLFSKGDVNSEFDFIVPGFVDIHCHGGGGYYFSENAPVARNLHVKSGTTTQIASLVTQEISTLISQIEYLKNQDVFGIHLEGPYLSKNFCGAHDPALLKPPTIKEISALLDAGEGKVKMFTIAPELEGALASIEYLVNKGIIVAIGHSAANSRQAIQAIKAGATVVTHFNNGMAKMGAIDSLSKAALESNLFLELIQDGHHVSKSDSLTVISKAPNRIVAVTDAMSAAGCGDGDYQIGDLAVTVKNSVARLSSNGSLAGSTLTMLDAFLNFVNLAGFEQAVRYTSINPAMVLGVNPYSNYIAIKDRQVVIL